MIYYKLSIILHILAVMLWIGHMLFWTLIVGPVTKRLEPQNSKEILRDISLRRGGLGWPCLIVLLITGTYILYYHGITLAYISSGDFFKTPFGQIISVKMLLVFSMIMYQTFVGHKPAPKLIYIDMLAAFLIIILSIVLVRSSRVGIFYRQIIYPRSSQSSSSHISNWKSIKSLGTVRFIIKSPDIENIIPTDAQLEQIATGFQFTEGPVWNHLEGYLLFSDIPANKIYKWIPGAGVSVFRSPSGKSNGLTLDKSGRLIAAEHLNRRISRTETDGTVVTLTSDYNGRRLNSPNDLVVKSNGSIYFTDPPYGLIAEHGSAKEQELDFQGVYMLSQDSKTLTLLLDDFDRPNGLAFSVDESTLYVSDQAQMYIKAFDVNEDGILGNGRLFAQVYGKNGKPDGIKVDLQDNVYMAGPNGIWIWDKDGRELGIILIPEIVGNMNWGDYDWKTLYVTASTSLYRVRLNIPGAVA